MNGILGVGEVVGWFVLSVIVLFVLWQTLLFFRWIFFGIWTGHKDCGEHRFHCDIGPDHYLPVTFRDAQATDYCQSPKAIYRRKCCRCGHITEVD